MKRLIIILSALLLTGCGSSIGITSSTAQPADTAPAASAYEQEAAAATTTAATTTSASKEVSPKLLTSKEDIALTETGEGSYTFTYNGEQFTAIYTPDNWKIIDSYRIRSKADITLICEALTDICPIHTSDYTDYRTPEDLAYEWEQHNIAYDLLPDSSEWKAHTKDVDLNPEDQGKSFIDMASDRLK
ncbi:MAG: hypothetical protein IJM75_01035 [Ruminococcus sp.]|nr:hypothetical protein [Ruminococcus sp.]